MKTEEPAIIGIGTALPPHRVLQPEGGIWLTSYFGYPDRARRFAERIFRTSVVESRYSVLPDFTNPMNAVLYRGEGRPRLDERMAVFRKEAPRLAQRACEKALANAAIQAEEITNLIVVTSTGFFTPGPDVDLAHALGLSPSAERMVLSMMGCSGAFPALRVARGIVASNSDARVLMVCVEISSLHLDDEPDHDKIVGYSLFGDAAAAVVIRASSGLTGTVGILGPGRTRLYYAGRSLLRWDLTSKGFSLRLSRDLVASVREQVKAFITPLVAAMTGGDGDARGIPSWMLHPGGPSLLDNIATELDLKPEALMASWQVLRSAGNLSSAAVLFVLEEERRRRRTGDRGILFGVGPGLTLEALAFTHGDRDIDHF